MYQTLFFNHSSFQTISKQFFHHLSQEINKLHIHSLNEISTKSFCNLCSDNSRGINRLIELNIHQVNRDFTVNCPSKNDKCFTKKIHQRFYSDTRPISRGTSALNCDIPTKLLNEMTILSLWNAVWREFGKLKFQWTIFFFRYRFLTSISILLKFLSCL